MTWLKRASWTRGSIRRQLKQNSQEIKGPGVSGGWRARHGPERYDEGSIYRPWAGGPKEGWWMRTPSQARVTQGIMVNSQEREAVVLQGWAAFKPKALDSIVMMVQLSILTMVVVRQSYKWQIAQNYMHTPWWVHVLLSWSELAVDYSNISVLILVLCYSCVRC